MSVATLVVRRDQGTSTLKSNRMSLSFESPQRQAGCLILMLACLLTGGWVRSCAISDVVSVPWYEIGSSGGGVWCSTTLSRPWEWNSRKVRPRDWNYHGNYWQFDEGRWALPYWSLVLPLSLCAACLILQKPDPDPTKPPLDPDPPQGS